MINMLVASDNEHACDTVQATFKKLSKVDVLPSTDAFCSLLCEADDQPHRFEFLFIDLDFLQRTEHGSGYRDFSKALQSVWQRFPGTEVIVMCPPEKIRGAVMAVKGGASDYVTYPIDREELKLVVETIEEQLRRQSELDHLRDDFWHTDGPFTVSTNSSTMRQVYQQMRSVAPTRSTVLLSGETGTGKGVAARLIHTHSNRCDGPFISVHCGAIPEALIESELFGHERGAFTGADRRKLGKFEVARGGTIFLDEVGTISQSAQIKLLQVLQEHSFSRVGGEVTIKADVRIIAATNDDLLELKRQGQFRSDLYYRLNVFPVEMPALRERPEDIPILVEEFLTRLNRLYAKKIWSIDRRVTDAFQIYTWPGNIRELENVMERAYILETANVLTPEYFPTELVAFPSVVASEKANGLPTLSEARQRSIEMVERQYLREILSLHKGRIDNSARAAGITTRQLYNLMTKYGLRKDDFR